MRKSQSGMLRARSKGVGPLLPVSAPGSGRSCTKAPTFLQMLLRLSVVASALFGLLYLGYLQQHDRGATNELTTDPRSMRDVEAVDMEPMDDPAVAPDTGVGAQDDADYQGSAGGGGELSGMAKLHEKRKQARMRGQTAAQEAAAQAKALSDAEAAASDGEANAEGIEEAVVLEDGTATGDVKNSQQLNYYPRIRPEGVYKMNVNDLWGRTYSLGNLAGSVTLFVNVASACGFTDANYKGLQTLYDKYKDHGFNVLGFPCNQFGAQEPGTPEEISKFTSEKYGVTFPLMSKVEVNGPNTHPIYRFLKRNLPAEYKAGKGDDLIWNFQKILVNKGGMPIKLYYQDFNMQQLEWDIYHTIWPEAQQIAERSRQRH